MRAHNFKALYIHSYVQSTLVITTTRYKDRGIIMTSESITVEKLTEFYYAKRLPISAISRYKVHLLWDEEGRYNECRLYKSIVINNFSKPTG